PRQPKRGSSRPPTKPASDPPSGMQTMVSVTANGRFRIGTYSDDSAAAFGIAPPRPNPARNRSAVSARTPVDIETRTVSAPNAPPPPSRPGRRAAPPPIPPADRAADHHPDHAGGLNRNERRPQKAPLAHHRRHRRAEQLVVEPVEDDRRRGRDDEQLLVGAPVRLVEQRADVDGVVADHCVPARAAAITALTMCRRMRPSPPRR